MAECTKAVGARVQNALNRIYKRLEKAFSNDPMEQADRSQPARVEEGRDTLALATAPNNSGGQPGRPIHGRQDPELHWGASQTAAALVGCCRSVPPG
jgi:hypothetical protein